MANISTNVDGVPCELEKLPDGRIRVRYEARHNHAVHGALAGSVIDYLVHPMQRHQYAALNAQLPAEQRSEPNPEIPRPWWSLGSGERAGFRE